LANVLHNEGSADLDVSPVALRPGALAGFTLAHLTGTAAFTLDEPARAELKRFVTAGGTLLIDAAGGSAAFAKAAEAELAATFSGATLALLPPDHALYSAGGTAPDAVTYRPFAQKALVGKSKSPRLRAITPGGRAAVLFSREDLSAGLVGEPVEGIVGYEPRTSTAIVRRIILYATSATPGRANVAGRKR
jgi:hypothetical protein